MLRLTRPGGIVVFVYVLLLRMVFFGWFRFPWVVGFSETYRIE